MQKWLLGALAAAFVLGVSGSGAMADDGNIHPPSVVLPPLGDADLDIVSQGPGIGGGHASTVAILMTATVSPVFSASPTAPGLARAPGLKHAPGPAPAP